MVDWPPCRADTVVNGSTSPPRDTASHRRNNSTKRSHSSSPSTTSAGHRHRRRLVRASDRKSERQAARQAIDDNEIITPPAGVIGAAYFGCGSPADERSRGNDSFQEFHGTHEWLFDEGRLISGKPIPGVGWVYVQGTRCADR